VKVAPDTNVLVRLVVGDHPAQGAAARQTLATADLVVITVPTLCELAWVLRSVYRVPPADVARAISALVAPAKIATDKAAVRAGLAVLEAGGDFADGAIAALGRSGGADEFITFDRQAAKLLAQAGIAARLLEAGGS
jgi:predicted nucleic-acid-binding protein